MCLTACIPPSPKSVYCDLPTTSLEHFLRTVWNAISWATVLTLPHIKLGSQLSHCIFFLIDKSSLFDGLLLSVGEISVPLRSQGQGQWSTPLRATSLPEGAGLGAVLLSFPAMSPRLESLPYQREEVTDWALVLFTPILGVFSTLWVGVGQRKRGPGLTSQLLLPGMGLLWQRAHGGWEILVIFPF